RIDNNTALTAINGFDNVTTVTGNGGVKIFSNQTLATIPGFSKLATIGSSLEIYSNPALGSLDAANGFEALTGLGSHIKIYGNTSLASLGGFTALASANAGISIYDNGLQTLSGFPNLTEIVGDLELRNNTALQTVAGFPKLAQIGGTLTIRDSDVLTQFDGLKALLKIGGSLFVKSTPVLSTIN